MNLSGAHDSGATPDRSPPRRSWFSLDWRSHWPTYVMAMNSILVLVGMGIMMLGLELKNTGIMLAGAVIFVLAALAWMIAGIVVVALILWAGFMWIRGRGNRRPNV